MYSHESARTGGAKKDARAPHRSGPALPGQLQGLLGLQGKAGNAAAVQLVRQSGHAEPRPQRHRHSAAGVGVIQRRVSLRDAQNPQSTRELSNEESVRAFLGQYHVSILEGVKTRMGANLGLGASGRVEFAAVAVIKGLLADEKNHVYEDSKAGAQELVEVICARVIKTLAEPQRAPVPATPSAMLRQMNQRQSSGGGPGASQGGPSSGPLADVLAKLARQKMAEHTSDSPFLTGLGKGAQSAVTSRAAVFTEPAPSAESVTEGMRWAAWVALEGEDKVRQVVERAAQQASPEESQRLMAQFDETLESKKREMEGTLLGSVATSGAVGQVANAIPHPGIKAGVKIGSMILGGLATAKKFGDGADAVQKIEQFSPQTYGKLRSARDQALNQAADDYVKRSHESTMEQMRDFGPFG